MAHSWLQSYHPKSDEPKFGSQLQKSKLASRGDGGPYRTWNQKKFQTQFFFSIFKFVLVEKLHIFYLLYYHRCNNYVAI